MKLNRKSICIIVIMFLVVITLKCISSTYAKYTGSINGEATATVAKWAFVDDNSSSVLKFNLAKTYDESTLVSGKIAPGTEGSFVIKIVNTNTETGVEYTVKFGETENVPSNLKFYTDAECTQEFDLENGYKGILAPKDSTGSDVTIYWKWLYETDLADGGVEAGDVLDTTDGENVETMTVTVVVTGIQLKPTDSVNKEETEEKDTGGTEEVVTTTLADVVSVGDYVNYDATSGNGAGKSYTTDSSLTGSCTQTTFNSSDITKWRVLSVNKEAGTVELMSADPTSETLTLYGQAGFINAENVLNDIGSIYGYGEGATGGRSINVDDVEQYSSYDKTTYTNSNSSTGYYGGTRSYTSGNFFKEIKDGSGNVTGYETSLTEASESNPVTMTQTYYRYAASSYFSNKTAYNMIFKESTDTSTYQTTYWLASRCVYLNSSYCNFDVRYVDSGNVYINDLYYSRGGVYIGVRAVSTVVSLKSNIQTSGQDSSGAWNLVID